MKNWLRVTSVMVLIGLAGCTADDPNKRAKTGAAIGAIAGAVLGNQVQHSGRGRVVGALLGAAAGGTIGHYMDNQQKEMEQQLAEEQRNHQLEVQRLRDDSLKIDINNEVSFDFDSTALKPAFLPTLDKVAGVLNRYPNTVVHILGYTDSVGSEQYNQRLSRLRADAVADYLASRGVSRDRLRPVGRGEMDPRASNATEAGRQLNRRVEIVIKPVVEGQESKAYEPPPPSQPASWNR